MRNRYLRNNRYRLDIIIQFASDTSMTYLHDKINKVGLDEHHIPFRFWTSTKKDKIIFTYCFDSLIATYKRAVMHRVYLKQTHLQFKTTITPTESL